MLPTALTAALFRVMCEIERNVRTGLRGKDEAVYSYIHRRTETQVRAESESPEKVPKRKKCGKVLFDPFKSLSHFRKTTKCFKKSRFATGGSFAVTKVGALCFSEALLLGFRFTKISPIQRRGC
jgi:hypothetical protein